MLEEPGAAAAEQAATTVALPADPGTNENNSFQLPKPVKNHQTKRLADAGVHSTHHILTAQTTKAAVNIHGPQGQGSSHLPWPSQQGQTGLQKEIYELKTYSRKEFYHSTRSK